MILSLKPESNVAGGRGCARARGVGAARAARALTLSFKPTILNTAVRLQEGAAAPAPAESVPRGLPALPAIPALGLYELPQIELPRNWLDIFAPLPAPKPAAPANAPEPVAPIQYDQLPALPARNRKLLQVPGYNPQGQQARSLAPWSGVVSHGQRLRAV